ncbi:hypothetical protein F0L74_21750 [Chitinophaga agrisoli]|uniref:Uncharacterized protein n=1 Tax=Chitinophaga agrisoli TaxID=2607653 RepID=A0A5B2VKL5_9BACT|nr:hypothetical protein [Chitinophaga agrisoli]KAA2238842.1 hypothetical protein F0L74_21750 [Chitinophaga agrisoli]
MPDIQLTLVNQSNDLHNSRIIIFKRDAAVPDKLPIAWLGIGPLGQGDGYPFVLPEQQGALGIRPVIWIGVLPQAEEGLEISVNSLPQAPAEIDLSGIISADIVITGTAGAFKFGLENTVRG